MLDILALILRDRGAWGKRGLFTEIGEKIGFSPAYIGQVLTNKKPLTDKFIEGMADYLGVTVDYLRFEYLADKTLGVDHEAHKKSDIGYIVSAAKIATPAELQSLVDKAKEIHGNHS